MGVLAWLSELMSARARPPGLVVPSTRAAGLRPLGLAGIRKKEEEALSKKQGLWEGDEEKVGKKRKRKGYYGHFIFFLITRSCSGRWVTKIVLALSVKLPIELKKKKATSVVKLSYAKLC